MSRSCEVCARKDNISNLLTYLLTNYFELLVY